MTGCIMWFQGDLRLSDNPALLEASKDGTVYPVFIFDTVHPAPHKIGAASKAWLHHSLLSLNERLSGQLNVYEGDPLKIIPDLTQRLGVKQVVWNHLYEPWAQERDRTLKDELRASQISCKSFNASLLWDPSQIVKDSGDPFRVFTPYYKKVLKMGATRAAVSFNQAVDWQKDPNALSVAELQLLPSHPWAAQMMRHWEVGELAAQQKLKTFLQGAVQHYKKGRDFPAQNAVSKLSMNLHFGEISPHQICEAIQEVTGSSGSEHFFRELIWREFSYALLMHFPTLPKENFQSSFDQFPWQTDQTKLKKWQQGMTGYPIVDAGMRELWETGYMHNRVRMIVGSFLVKNLLQHWHHGFDWFWDCLVDADLANNAASWQWVAGSGADAAPYFRVFNPVLQGKKFDPQGEYTKKYVPELKNMPDNFLFDPWNAPEEVLQSAGVQLGKTYPRPMVDLALSRDRALASYQQMKSA